MTLTKADIIDRVHKANPSMTRAQARAAVETTLASIKSRLATGDNVLLSGFGKFCVNDKSARKGRNPQTGESLMLESRRVVTFKPSGKLREKVNGK